VIPSADNASVFPTKAANLPPQKGYSNSVTISQAYAFPKLSVVLKMKIAPTPMGRLIPRCIAMRHFAPVAREKISASLAPQTSSAEVLRISVCSKQQPIKNFVANLVATILNALGGQNVAISTGSSSVNLRSIR
jgi:hypothetical protein